LAVALETARARGLLGDAPLSAQVAHALGFASAAESVRGAPPRRFLDLGAGGGLPGLVLAERWPDVLGTLLDAGRRRTRLLSEAVARLGWEDRIAVVWGRAEEAGRDPDHRSAYGLVTARSFGPPAVVAECGSPFLEVGGLLVVSEPPPPAADPCGGGTPVAPERWPARALSALGLEVVRRWEGAFGYQVLRQREPCPDRYPRRPGLPAKRPLYR
jgi:16S rRNA (guanine527-N7)-methyltransferase